MQNMRQRFDAFMLGVNIVLMAAMVALMIVTLTAESKLTCEPQAPRVKHPFMEPV